MQNTKLATTATMKEIRLDMIRVRSRLARVVKPVEVVPTCPHCGDITVDIDAHVADFHRFE